MSSMNDFIRQAAGRLPQPAADGEQIAPRVPRGNAGSGHGQGGFAEINPTQRMNQWLREARHLKSLEIKEIWPR